MKVAVYTRHSDSCQRKNERHGRRCKCWKYLDIKHDNGKRELRSAKTRSWEEAERLKNALLEQHDAGRPVDSAGKMTVRGAVVAFIDSRRNESTKETTIRILRLLLDKRLVEFCESNGLIYLYQIKLADVEAFRSTWPGGALTRHKMQERLKSFFRYCVEHQWIEVNPSSGLRRIKVDQKPTDYFTPDEFKSLLDACYEPEQRALLLLLRWTGLRISDALGLEKSRIKGNRLFLYTMKSGTPVTVPIHENVLDALASFKRKSDRYYFWNGTCELETVRKDWTELFALIAKRANIGKRAHFHMFRDTFAVELLLKGVPMDQVSIALGHRSIRVTERHYSPFVKARQEQLEESIKKSWDDNILNIKS